MEYSSRNNAIIILNVDYIIIGEVFKIYRCLDFKSVCLVPCSFPKSSYRIMSL